MDGHVSRYDRKGRSCMHGAGRSWPTNQPLETESGLKMDLNWTIVPRKDWKVPMSLKVWHIDRCYYGLMDRMQLEDIHVSLLASWHASITGAWNRRCLHASWQTTHHEVRTTLFAGCKRAHLNGTCSDPSVTPSVFFTVVHGYTSYLFLYKNNGLISRSRKDPM